MNTLTLIAVGLCLISFIILVASFDRHNIPTDRAVSMPKPSEIREFYIRCDHCVYELSMIYEETLKPKFFVALKFGDDCPTHSVSDEEHLK